MFMRRLVSCRALGLYRSPSYPDTDSLAEMSGDVYRRSPLGALDCPETFSLLKSWMQECILHHDSCRRTLAGDLIDDRSFAPWRVVDVGCYSRPPRLIQT